jgi:hypothetical protein
MNTFFKDFFKNFFAKLVVGGLLTCLVGSALYLVAGAIAKHPQVSIYVALGALISYTVGHYIISDNKVGRS